jgi:cation transport regulator ChaB
MPTDKEDLPGTIQRSPRKAQRTYAKALDSAHDQYDSEERAHRVAYSALKHTHEKVGDHWEPKDGSGPSDERASNPRARQDEGETAGGVDVAGHTRKSSMNGRRSSTSLGARR